MELYLNGDEVRQSNLNQLVSSYDDLGKWKIGSQPLEKEQSRVRADEEKLAFCSVGK
jgi:hypothetical protein